MMLYAIRTVLFGSPVKHSMDSAFVMFIFTHFIIAIGSYITVIKIPCCENLLLSIDIT